MLGINLLVMSRLEVLFSRVVTSTAEKGFKAEEYCKEYCAQRANW